MDETEFFNFKFSQVIQSLCGVPREQRDFKWAENFLTYIPTAAMVAGEPPVQTGPDGFPYFALKFPPEGEEIDAYSVVYLLEHVCQEGMGIAVNPNPRSKDVDWIFSYGDLWNFALTGEFYSDPTRNNFSTASEGSPPTEVMIAQPSESFFPQYVREVIARGLKETFAIPAPSVVMVIDPKSSSGRSLAFNVFVEDFEKQDLYDFAMRFLSWSLPRDYGLIEAKKSAVYAKSFSPLIEE